MAAARGGTDVWSIFLRQRRVRDRLRRLKNDFKDCYCPQGCRGGPHNHVGVDPASLPAQPLHGPYVRADSALPNARNRTSDRRDPNCRILAEARGTSDIGLRDGSRATLRMSLQVHSDVSYGGRTGYYAEMWLTRHGRGEEFVGLINTWHVDRRTNEWEEVLLGQGGRRYITGQDGTQYRTDLQSTRVYFLILYGDDPDDRYEDDNGVLLPIEDSSTGFGAPWAMLNDDTDILYIPLIYIRQDFTGNRIIDQGFELLFRLMTGGTLPYPYNLTRPLSALLEVGLLQGDFAIDWIDPTGTGEMDLVTQTERITQAYERNGFIRILNDYHFMGRRVEVGDHPAARGDVEMQPPDPPGEDPNTPPAVRNLRYDRAVDLARAAAQSPLEGREGTRPRDGRGGRGQGRGRGRGKGDRGRVGGLRLPGM